tara:strand:+ start:11161 stop:11703 length:543 start_codon:yes stop_codon:yes gene_type:complete
MEMVIEVWEEVLVIFGVHAYSPYMPGEYNGWGGEKFVCIVEGKKVLLQELVLRTCVEGRSLDLPIPNDAMLQASRTLSIGPGFNLGIQPFVSLKLFFVVYSFEMSCNLGCIFIKRKREGGKLLGVFWIILVIFVPDVRPRHHIVFLFDMARYHTTIMTSTMASEEHKSTRTKLVSGFLFT